MRTRKILRQPGQSRLAEEPVHGRMTAAGCSLAAVLAVSPARTGESAGHRDNRNASLEGQPGCQRHTGCPPGIREVYERAAGGTRAAATRAGRPEWRGMRNRPCRPRRAAVARRTATRGAHAGCVPLGADAPVMAGFHRREPAHGRSCSTAGGCPAGGERNAGAPGTGTGRSAVPARGPRP